MTALDRVAALPRVGLGAWPTPLQEAPLLSEELGVEVWLKRDDLCGFGLGGNKVRVVEFLLGRALEDGCDVLVTGSGPQSNWSMLAALGARRCGMDSVVCFYGDPPADERGNLLLHRLTGAEVRWTGDPDRRSVDAAIEAAGDELRAAGRRPVVLPRGGATGTGSVGYLLGAWEIRGQQPSGPVTVWLGTGSCGTQGGLLAGVMDGALDRVIGVTVSRPAEECRQRVAELAAAAGELVGVPPAPPEVVEIEDGWIGDGYGIPSAAGAEAARLVARTEGILLDPIFGAKAMAALADAARSGRIDGPVVFLVTGGAPTLFASGEGL